MSEQFVHRCVVCTGSCDNLPHDGKIEPWFTLGGLRAIHNQCLEGIWETYCHVEGKRSRAEKAEERVYELRNMLNLLLDQVDYTSGACRVNEMIGAVLGKNLIGAARKLVKGGEG